MYNTKKKGKLLSCLADKLMIFFHGQSANTASVCVVNLTINVYKNIGLYFADKWIFESM